MIKQFNPAYGNAWKTYPSAVRQIILLALAKGWSPDQGGRMLDLGSIDDDIDFSELRNRSKSIGNQDHVLELLIIAKISIKIFLQQVIDYF